MTKLKKKVTLERRACRQHTGAFMAQVVLATLCDDKTAIQLCQDHDLHANQIPEWKRQLLERTVDIFGSADPPKPVDLVPMHAMTSQLTLGNDFLKTCPR